MPQHNAHVAHHVKGRIRVRLPKAKRDISLLESVQRAITPMEGVDSVEINPATGSVVIHYDAAKHEDFHAVLSKHAEHKDLFMLAPPEVGDVDEMAKRIEEEAEFLSERSETAKAIVDFFKGMNQQLKKATNNSVDLQVLLPLGLAVYAFFELEADVTTPLWVTLGIFSFNSFMHLHHPLPTTMEVEHEELESSQPGKEPVKARRTRRTIRKGGA